MQIEAGKKYVDRRGRVYGPMVVSGSYVGESESDTDCWYLNGMREQDGYSETDLIAEHVDPVPAQTHKDVEIKLCVSAEDPCVVMMYRASDDCPKYCVPVTFDGSKLTVRLPKEC